MPAKCSILALQDIAGQENQALMLFNPPEKQ
jgi:hypothetical protein